MLAICKNISTMRVYMEADVPIPPGATFEATDMVACEKLEQAGLICILVVEDNGKARVRGTDKEYHYGKARPGRKRRLDPVLPSFSA